MINFNDNRAPSPRFGPFTLTVITANSDIHCRETYIRHLQHIPHYFYQFGNLIHFDPLWPKWKGFKDRARPVGLALNPPTMATCLRYTRRLVYSYLSSITRQTTKRERKRHHIFLIYLHLSLSYPSLIPFHFIDLLRRARVRPS